MNKNQFSNDKLFFHTDKLMSVLDGKMVAPSVYEISLCGSCNCACSYCCCKNYHNEIMLTLEDLHCLSEQISTNGSGAVVLTGGGEPMLNPYFLEALKVFHEMSLSVGVITNGLLLKEEQIPVIAECAKFFRISLDTSDPIRYQKMRGVLPNLDIMYSRMSSLAEYKRKSKSDIRLGAQIVYVNQPADDLEKTIQFCRDTGFDFIQIRPIDNAEGVYLNRKERYNFYRENKTKLIQFKEVYSNDSFEVIINDNKFREYYNGMVGKTYRQCLGANFTMAIGHDMCLYFCCANIGNKSFQIGSLREHSLRDLLMSDRRRELIENPIYEKCQAQCRNHIINIILDELIHMPTEEARKFVQEKADGEIPEHVEFL